MLVSDWVEKTFWLKEPGLYRRALSVKSVPLSLAGLDSSILSGNTGLRGKGKVTVNIFFQNPNVAKAKLISRMAKMGQPMLPFLAGTAGSQLDSSDSEIEVH